MAQFKIYGDRAFLETNALVISDAIHGACVDSLGLPDGKRFHRFIPLDPWQFLHPADRASSYLIIELMMFAGRSIETKKVFYASLLRNMHAECGIDADDVELTITESPRHDWLIRGVPGDELLLDYNVNHVADDKV